MCIYIYMYIYIHTSSKARLKVRSAFLVIPKVFLWYEVWYNVLLLY